MYKFPLFIRTQLYWSRGLLYVRYIWARHYPKIYSVNLEQVYSLPTLLFCPQSVSCCWITAPICWGTVLLLLGTITLKLILTFWAPVCLLVIGMTAWHYGHFLWIPPFIVWQCQLLLLICSFLVSSSSQGQSFMEIPLHCFTLNLLKGIQNREVSVNSRAILSLADKPTETSLFSND